MKASKMFFFSAVILCVFTTANAQRHDSRHSHFDNPEVINGLTEPDRLSPGVQLQYVLTARLSDLKEELSGEDFAIVSAGVEKIKAAKERRKARELEEFDYMCRNLAFLDIESILGIAERPHLEMMNRSDSAVRKHISGLTSRGKKILRDMKATTDYGIVVVRPNISEYARKHPDYFRASVSEKCQSYLSQIGDEG